ncbi:MAG: hypothetical protein ACKVZ0_23050 [Gemmatimonadales bacterium]
MSSVEAVVRVCRAGVATSAIRVGFAGLAGLLWACGPAKSTEPLPPNAVAFEAPALFAEWWARTESCSGQRGNLSEIGWFVVPGAEFATSRGVKVASWSHGGAGVEIVVASDFVNDEMVVRHEMLHALLDETGHPRGYFVAKCHLTWQSWGDERPVTRPPDVAAGLRAR